MEWYHIIDAFYRCQTPISFPHFGMEREWSFVCGNGMAQHNQTGPYRLSPSYQYNTEGGLKKKVGLGLFFIEAWGYDRNPTDGSGVSGER